jgi:hypothetical protein
MTLPVCTLQAKLRAQFIQDLQLRGKLPVEARPRKSVTVSDRLVNSLVAEHLRQEHMEATLSVFLPESGCVVLSACVGMGRGLGLGMGMGVGVGVGKADGRDSKPPPHHCLPHMAPCATAPLRRCASGQFAWIRIPTV